MLLLSTTNGGSTWTVHTDAQEADNLTITNGSTNTSLTASVPHGSSIQWRYKSSDTSGDWTGLSYVTDLDMNSSTVDCPQPEVSSISQSLVHVLEDGSKDINTYNYKW